MHPPRSRAGRGPVSLRPFDVANRALAAATVGLLALLGLSLRLAEASVSIPVTFDDLVRRATAVAVVTPIDEHGVWEAGRIVTYTRVRVERRVAGRLAAEVWVHTDGGAVGKIGQLVEGEATLKLGKDSLVFLHPRSDGLSIIGSSDGGATTTFGVVEGAQGQFPIATGGHPSPRLVVSPGMGGLLPTSSTQPLARDVLVDVALEDAANAIAAAWTRWHPAGQEAP